MEKDEIARRIEAFDVANGGGVGWYEDKGAYHLYLCLLYTSDAADE